jgi:hypothetical protein
MVSLKVGIGDEKKAGFAKMYQLNVFKGALAL